jgi:hypothetical protein
MESSVRNVRSRSELTSDTSVWSATRAEHFWRFPRKHVSSREQTVAFQTLRRLCPYERIGSGRTGCPTQSRTGLCHSARNGNFRCRDRAPFGGTIGSRDARETRRIAKTLHFERQIEGCATESDSYELGGGGRSQMRTGLRSNFPTAGKNTGNLAVLERSTAYKIRELAAPQAFLIISMPFFCRESSCEKQGNPDQRPST